MEELVESQPEEINKTTDQENDQAVMQKEELSQRVKELLDSRNKIDQELEELKSKCDHKDHSVRYVQHNGTQALRIVCDICDSIIGFPNPKQIEEWKDI